MERATVRTLLLVVGSAIGGIVLFVVGAYGYLVYKINSGGNLPSVSISSEPRERGEIVAVPPEIKQRFLGSSASSRGFPIDRSRMLASGPGTIAGRATAGT